MYHSLVELRQNIAFVLAERILNLVEESGADKTDARCALEAAIAFLPELGLQVKPTAVISSGPLS
jgi:hypothetical protein